jgi:protein-disulfide isomerase
MRTFSAAIQKINLALCAVLLLQAVGGCRTQTTKASDTLSEAIIRRIQNEIRSRYNVRDDIQMAVSALRESDIPGFDKFTVVFTGGTRTTSFDFLISKDRKKIVHMDLEADISADVMSLIDVKGRPFRGSEQAKVVIVSYQDFQCPACLLMHSALFPGLMREYASKVKIIYKDYPLVEIHPWAMHAAVDANCLAAQNQDAYWDFADYLFANRKEVAGTSREEAFANLDKAALDQAAKRNLDIQKITACTQKQDESVIRASMAEGEKVGVEATPTLFIDGERVAGAIPAEKLRPMLDRAVAEHK